MGAVIGGVLEIECDKEELWPPHTASDLRQSIRALRTGQGCQGAG